MFNSGFRSLSKLDFKCSVIQQRVTVVLDFMSFEALSCKGGASISISTSRALMLGVLVWHIPGFTTVIMLPCMLTYSGWYSFIPLFTHSAFYPCNLGNCDDTTSQLQTYQMPILVMVIKSYGSQRVT